MFICIKNYNLYDNFYNLNMNLSSNSFKRRTYSYVLISFILKV